MIKNYDLRKIKSFYSYTIKELAALYKVTTRTIQQMLANGLKKIDDKRPVLVMGCDFLEFEKKRRIKRRSISEDESFIYCVACKKHVKAKNNKIYIERSGKTLGSGKEKITIKARCSDCGNIINRFGSSLELEELSKIFQIVPTIEDF